MTYSVQNINDSWPILYKIWLPILSANQPQPKLPIIRLTELRNVTIAMKDNGYDGKDNGDAKRLYMSM